MNDGRTQQSIRQSVRKLVGPKAASAVGRQMRTAAEARFSAQLMLRTSELRSQRSQLRGFRDSHVGQRCVIIGNGPSLRDTDMSLLRNEVTFGLNRVYLAFDDWGWDTTYHVAVNKYVAEQSASELARVTSPLFSTVANIDHFRGADRIPLLLMNHRSPAFYGDVRFGVWEGATVTYVAMQLAFYMGFHEVILVGVDHHFSSTGPAHELVESTSQDVDHFDPRYFGPGYKWQLPDLETSEIAYKMARQAYAKDGRTIVDATLGGKLTVFPKVSLGDALR
jgi:hypothetical protein